MDVTPYKKPEYFRNRELSWISFDERVLNEARDKRTSEIYQHYLLQSG